MKILGLQAENIKRIVAVDIRPTDNVVKITGKNGQGKTSILDAIWWALAGASHIQEAPIRKGQNEARIMLDMGEVKVTRKFKRKEKDGEVTTSIVVEKADGARFPRPQEMLDGLLGKLTFDPLAFSRMEPKKQFDTLREFVPDFDFVALENQQRGDRERRQEINAAAKRAQGAADSIVIPENLEGAEPIDEEAILNAMQEASDKNTEIERRKAAREQAAARIETLKAQAIGARSRMESTRENVKDEMARLKEEFDRRLKAIEAKAAGDLQALEDSAGEDEAEAAKLEKKLAEAEPLPEPVDTGELRRKLDEAKAHNASLAKVIEKRKHQEEAERLKAQASALSDRMDDREAAKRKAIADAKLPVDGITFGDDEVLLNGLPFNQASDAEQLRVSCAIAMASNPDLRVIRVRDGSLLDETSLAMLEKMAGDRDYQVWIEMVDSSGKVGIVIEDGRARVADAAE